MTSLLNAKDAQSLTDVILSKITADDLDFQDCRGQGYDNTATMAGKHSGVQWRLLQVNCKAQFVPCRNHSLVTRTVKRIVETSWSARHNAVFAIKSHYKNVIDVLEKLTEHNKNADTLASISTFPFLCLLNLWENILPEVDSVQNYLQTKGQAMHAVESLLKFLTDQRDCLVNNALDTAMHTCARNGHSTCPSRTQEAPNG